MKKFWILGGLFIVLLAAWFLISPAFIVVELDEQTPSENIILKGDFKEADHEVKGSASIVETNDGKVLRFENFETINGPDLRIYLSADLEAEDFVEVSKIKATKGNVNYNLEDVDLEKYNKVLVWCKPFGVLFSYAELE